MAQLDPSTDPAAQEPEMGEADAGSSYTIEIAVAADGSITVSCEGAAQEGAEPSMGDQSQDMASAQPAANIKEALTLALAAYKSNGKLPDVQGQDDKFQEGFASGPGAAQ